MTQNSTKSVFLTILFVLLTTASNIIYAQTKVGIKAGVNFSNMMITNENGNKENTQSTPGFLLGLTADIPVTGDLYIQPAILYSSKGFKQETGGFYGSATNFEVKASYIEVPLNMLYKPRLGAGHLLVGAGPFMAYGTGGNWSSDTDILIGDIRIKGEGNVAFRNDGSIRNDAEYTYGRPLDYGANFLAGYEFFGQLSIQFNAQVGINDLKPEVDGVKREGKLKNKGFGISLGYKF